MAVPAPGPRNAITDVAGVLVGNAGDARLKSGVTVLTAERPFVAAVDIRGGAPGTRETDLLAPGRLVPAVVAIVLAGGSAFGLAAASGVADRLRALGRGFRAGAAVVPIVPAAILFDLANGGDKGWEENPYPALGAAALAAAAEDFAIGSEGAGTGAMTATVMGGLGTASLVLEGGTTVGALVAVNAFGGVCPPGSRRFWAGVFEVGDEFGGLGPVAAAVPPFAARAMKPGPRQGGGAAAGGGGAHGDGAGDRTGAYGVRRRSRLRGGVGGEGGRRAGRGGRARSCGGAVPGAGDRAGGPCGAADGGEPAAVLERARGRGLGFS
jgi:L-aminopeptidase/D-esterase-like protein